MKKLVYALVYTGMFLILVGCEMKDKNSMNEKKNRIAENKSSQASSNSLDDVDAIEGENLETYNGNDEKMNENNKSINEKDRSNEDDRINDKTDDISESKGNDNIKTIEYSLDEQGIITSEDGKEIIWRLSSEVVEAISKKDFATLANYVHPTLGVRFIPYTHISIDTSISFTKEEIKSFFEDKKEYLWGVYDGRGDDIMLTPAQYYDEFIYSVDYKNPEAIGYNEALSTGNMIANEHEIYENAIVVEYYFSGFKKEYAGADWKSLKLVYQEVDGNWVLVCIIHNQWTI